MGKNTGGNRKKGRAGDAGQNGDTKPAKSIGGLWFDDTAHVWRQKTNGQIVPGFKGEKIPLKANLSASRYGKHGMLTVPATAAEVNGVSLSAGTDKLASGYSAPMRIKTTNIGNQKFVLVASASGQVRALAKTRENLLGFAADMMFTVYE
ncbi:MAG TPA: hypothetical protein PL187_00250 [Caldilinea sp.]|nr:hypothetical protein [Caldilinea sp.]